MLFLPLDCATGGNKGLGAVNISLSVYTLPFITVFPHDGCRLEVSWFHIDSEKTEEERERERQRETERQTDRETERDRERQRDREREREREAKSKEIQVKRKFQRTGKMAGEWGEQGCLMLGRVLCPNIL